MSQAGVHTSESPELLLFVITTLLYFFVGRAVACVPQHTRVEVRGQSTASVLFSHHVGPWD